VLHGLCPCSASFGKRYTGITRVELLMSVCCVCVFIILHTYARWVANKCCEDNLLTRNFFLVIKNFFTKTQIFEIPEISILIWKFTLYPRGGCVRTSFEGIGIYTTQIKTNHNLHTRAYEFRLCLSQWGSATSEVHKLSCVDMISFFLM